jgi:alpha-methylacyl-CoA racemase
MADGPLTGIRVLEFASRAKILCPPFAKDEFDAGLPQRQMDRTSWGDMRRILREVFAMHTRQEWCDLLEHTDVCFAPVLSLPEASEHPHNRARETFVEVAGVVQPAPAPRFSATPSRIQWPPAPIVRDTRQALRNWGVSEETLGRLLGASAGEPQ